MRLRSRPFLDLGQAGQSHQPTTARHDARLAPDGLEPPRRIAPAFTVCYPIRLGSGFPHLLGSPMFFYASKILWMLAQPSNLLLLLVLAGTLALLIRRHRLAAWLLVPTAAVLALVGLLPVGDWLALPLENRFPALAEPPERVDGIVVLGGAVDLEVADGRGVVAFKEGAERIIALIALARRYPDARVVFTGGQSWVLGTDNSEARVIRTFAREQGLDGARVIFEDQAQNTYQNAVYSKALALPAAGEQWLLVTSAAHMPRSVGVFRRVGWPVIPYPVDYRTSGEIRLWAGLDASEQLFEFDHAVKAWIGLVAYRLSGRTDALFPGP